MRKKHEVVPTPAAPTPLLLDHQCNPNGWLGIYNQFDGGANCAAEVASRSECNSKYFNWASGDHGGDGNCGCVYNTEDLWCEDSGNQEVHGTGGRVRIMYTAPTPAPTLACTTTSTQLAYNGYVYQTLAGAPVDGTVQYTTEEQTYMAMPAGYDVAPDDASVVADVIATHTWDAWRLCTQTRTWLGLHYGLGPGKAGSDGTSGGVLEPNWETDGQGQYRIIPGTPDWTRLLIRAQCQAPN